MATEKSSSGLAVQTDYKTLKTICSWLVLQLKEYVNKGRYPVANFSSMRRKNRQYKDV